MMKMMKKVLLFTLLCAMLLSLCLPVSADVILEPEDDFFQEHREECEYQGYRYYLVNSTKGHAYLYVSPGSSATIEGYQNGEQVAVLWLYTDDLGEVWGALSYEKGWFRMSELSLIYDSIAFLEEHTLTDYTPGSYPMEAGKAASAIMWEYPGKRTDVFFEEDVEKYISKVYTDEAGEVWGYLSYYRGHRNVWVCLTDPYSDENKQGEETQPALLADPTPIDQIPAREPDGTLLSVTGILIAALLLVTGAVIVAVFVRKKRTPGEEA